MKTYLANRVDGLRLEVSAPSGNTNELGSEDARVELQMLWTLR